MPALSELEKKKAHVAHLISIGKSQSEAADIVGVSRETVSRWKRSDPNFMALINRDEIEKRVKLVKSGALSEDLKKVSSADLHAMQYKLVGLAQDALDVHARVMRDPDSSNRDKLNAAQYVLEKVMPTPRQRETQPVQIFTEQSAKSLLGDAVKLLSSEEVIEAPRED